MVVLFPLHFLNKILDDCFVDEIVLQFLARVEVRVGLRSDEVYLDVRMGVVFADF